jgi:hypothetical protein
MSTAGSPQGLDEAILRWAAPEEVEVRFAPAIRCPEASKGHRRVRCGPDVAGPFMLPWRPVMAVPDLFKVRVDPQVPPSCDTGFILDRLFGFRSRMSSPDSSLVPMVFAGYTRSHATLASDIQIYMFSSGMRISQCPRRGGRGGYSKDRRITGREISAPLWQMWQTVN